MAVQNKQMCWSIQASEALNNLTAGTGHLYKAVGTTGAITGDDNNALGILQEGADNGGHVSLAIFGISKFVASAAITAGKMLTVTTSGYFVTAASGDHVVGRALTAPGSGAVGTGFFNFSNPFAVVNSNGIN